MRCSYALFLCAVHMHSMYARMQSRDAGSSATAPGRPDGLGSLREVTYPPSLAFLPIPAPRPILPIPTPFSILALRPILPIRAHLLQVVAWRGRSAGMGKSKAYGKGIFSLT